MTRSLGLRAFSPLQRALAITLCVVALLLRLYGLDFGRALPYVSHPDEPTQVAAAQRMLERGSANPGFFKYPSLAIYLEAAGLVVGCAASSSCKVGELPKARIVNSGVGRYPSAAPVLGARAIAAVVAAGAVLACGLAVAFLVGNPWLCLLAMAAVALHPEHARFSQFATVDAIATTFALLSVAAAEHHVAKGGRSWQAAAVLTGLAVSSKYSYVFWTLGLACPIALHAWREGGPVKALRRTAAFMALAGLAFALTSPFVLLTPRQAAIDFLSEVRHYSTGHLGNAGNTPLWYLSYLLTTHVGVTILGVGGLALVLRRRALPGVPTLAALAVYFAAICVQNVHFDRNALPVAIGLVIPSALLLDVALQRLAGAARLAALGVGATLCLAPNAGLLESLRARTRTTSRAAAQRFVDELKPAGTPLLAVAEGYTVVLPSWIETRYVRSLTELRPDDAAPPDLVWVGAGMFRRFYADRPSFAAQAELYDRVLASPDTRCFASTRASGASPADDAVCVRVLSPRARAALNGLASSTWAGTQLLAHLRSATGGD